MILRLTSSEQTTKFPAHSALLIQNGRCLVVDLRQKKSIHQQKVNKQALVLKFASENSGAAQLKFLA